MTIVPFQSNHLDGFRSLVSETLPGWQEPIDDGLPQAARAYVDFVEQQLGVEISLVGTGAERERVVSLR